MTTLEDFFKRHPRAALAFSGGTDSSYLLAEGLRYGESVRPYYVKTVFQPQFEFEDAQRLAAQLGTELSVITLDVLSAPRIAENPADRCYRCKRFLFGELKKHAERDGFALLLDGTNASDDAGDRPGMRALTELGVRSPLRECGLSKETIRAHSKAAGLFTWNKPAYACLATRIPCGAEITAELLARIEAAESAVAAMGFTDFRIRVFHGAARIQLKEEQIRRAAAQAERVRTAVAPYFSDVFLDTACR